MRPNQTVSLTALNGETIDGLYMRLLSQDEKHRLFDINYARDIQFAWVETHHGTGWFEARRLVVAT